MKQNIVKTKSFNFAIAVAQCCRSLIDQKEYVLSKQLLRSGTSIGANVREAMYSPTRRDFIYKLTVSLQECNETLFWLEILNTSRYLDASTFDSLHHDASELLKILSSITKTARENLKKLTVSKKMTQSNS
jgi:four helix bundle protein